jgi:hypothetical protein
MQEAVAHTRVVWLRWPILRQRQQPSTSPNRVVDPLLDQVIGEPADAGRSWGGPSMTLAWVVHTRPQVHPDLIAAHGVRKTVAVAVPEQILR